MGIIPTVTNVTVGNHGVTEWLKTVKRWYGETSSRKPARQIVFPSFVFGHSSARQYRTSRGSGAGIAMAAVSFLMVLVLTVTFVQTQVAYAVYFNGSEVGSVRSMSEVNAVLESVEQKLREAFGDDYSIDGAIFVSPALGSAGDSADGMAEAILSGIEGLVKLPVLKVGGVIVGAGETVEQLRELVEGVIGAYAAPDTIKVQLRQSVAIAEEYVREDIQKNPDVLRALLDPANLNSPFSLTVETIRQVSYTEAVPARRSISRTRRCRRRGGRPRRGDRRRPQDYGKRALRQRRNRGEVGRRHGGFKRAG